MQLDKRSRSSEDSALPSTHFQPAGSTWCTEMLTAFPPQGKIQWEGDTPAVWHHYFEPLKAVIEPGYFVDVGAGDGVFTSNTFFLERQRCWRGMAIEPTNNEYPKLERQRIGTTTVCTMAHCLRKHLRKCCESCGMFDARCGRHEPASKRTLAQRKRCTPSQVHGAVCEQDGWRPFLDVTLDGLWTGWSGFKDTFDDHHAHQVVDMHIGRCCHSNSCLAELSALNTVGGSPDANMCVPRCAAHDDVPEAWQLCAVPALTPATVSSRSMRMCV